MVAQFARHFTTCYPSSCRSNASFNDCLLATLKARSALAEHEQHPRALDPYIHQFAPHFPLSVPSSYKKEMEHLAHIITVFVESKPGDRRRGSGFCNCLLVEVGHVTPFVEMPALLTLPKAPCRYKVYSWGQRFFHTSPSKRDMA